MLGWVSGSLEELAVVTLVVALSASLLVGLRARRAPLRDAIRATALDAAVAGSLAPVLVLALRPASNATADGFSINLIPFRDLIWSLGDSARTSGAVADIVGNVVVFVPLGAALAARFARLGLAATMLGVAMLSASIEVTQALLAAGRAADVTDVLMNSLGALIGHAAWRSWRA